MIKNKGPVLMKTNLCTLNVMTLRKLLSMPRNLRMREATLFFA